MSSAQLPVGPLLAALHGKNLAGCTRRDSTQRLTRALLRAKARGQVSIWMADELAIGIAGTHPASIWGEQWITAISS